jgi:uncharacterized protein YprB with RNaseH-like and TPR domain
MKRKRPSGSEWELFVKEWHESSHEDKVRLCDKYDITYDIGKHWLSDTGNGNPHPVDKPKMLVTQDELLAGKFATKLDFVSFDIETSNLNADFSVLLSACIKPFGQETIVFRADNYSTWKSNRANDTMILKDIVAELRQHAIVITHYGRKFDIPFIRAKMVKAGMEPLPLMFGIDSWRIAKDNFKVASRKLVNLAEFFQIGTKGGVEGNLWMAAAYDGSKEAMDEIVEHNIVDVKVLERLACVSFPYLKSIPRL